MSDPALVLIVEDDHDLATARQQILGDCGQETRLTANGVQALDAVAACMPSVILLDMRMPVRHAHAAPIIVMTAAENRASAPPRSERPASSSSRSGSSS